MGAYKHLKVITFSNYQALKRRPILLINSKAASSYYLAASIGFDRIPATEDANGSKECVFFYLQLMSNFWMICFPNKKINFQFKIAHKYS